MERKGIIAEMHENMIIDKKPKWCGYEVCNEKAEMMNSWFVKYSLRAKHTTRCYGVYECETKDL